MTLQERLNTLKPNAIVSVVDDDASVRRSLGRLLKSMGFEVQTYSSAMEFLQNGPLHAYGCAVIDVRMPGMSGLDLQKQLLADGIGLPVVIISALEDNGIQSQALETGALAFLQKPFSDPSLLEALCLALEHCKRSALQDGNNGR